jgi:hypothetical protein
MSAEGTPVVEERSIRDELTAALAEAKGRQAAENPPDLVTPNEETPSGPARNEQGRFAKGEIAPVDGAASAAPVAGATPEAPKAIDPPTSLSPEIKALWPSLDPKVQAEWAKRETDSHKKISANDEERVFGKKIKDLASPYMATFNAEGATVEQGFQQFLNTSYVLRTGTPQQKLQALLSVAQQFGVPLNQQNLSPQSNIALHPAIETLQQRLDRIERDKQAETTQRQQQEGHAIQSEIEAFSQNPAHPHFETVKAHMGALLQSGLANDLQDAYEQACNAHPEVRSTLAAAQTAAANEKQTAALKAKAEAAKKAAGSVTGGPGGARPPQPQGASAGSIRDDIKAAFREHTGGRV